MTGLRRSLGYLIAAAKRGGLRGEVSGEVECAPGLRTDRRSVTPGAAIATLAAVLAATVAVTVGSSRPAHATPGTTERVSLVNDDGQADAASDHPSVSYDGRYGAFSSSADNLVPGDTNGVADVFVYDRVTRTTQRVSVDSSGGQANGASREPVSCGGDCVVFTSDATNLVAGDTNGVADVFVYDPSLTPPANIQRVSVDSAGGQANGASREPALTVGYQVAFTSDATNLVAGDTNGVSDIFAFDLGSRTTERVSVDSAGGQANGPSREPASDGGLIAFTSDATNLVVDDTNGATDIFVRYRWSALTERWSIDSDGGQANGPSREPSISGELVAFTSDATNLVPDDTNGVADVFRFSHTNFLNPIPGEVTTERLSVDQSGVQANGPSREPATLDGSQFYFVSDATNLDPNGDTNGAADVFLRWPSNYTTYRVSYDGAVGQANGPSGEPAPFGSGVAFTSDATNLVPGDTNGGADVFLSENGIERVSMTSPEGDAASATTDVGDRGSVLSSMSADGRFVVFSSAADNLVSGDTNGDWDVFVRDRQTNRTERVSVDSSGREFAGPSGEPAAHGSVNSSYGLGAISADGRFVAFNSGAYPDRRGLVRDREAQTTELVSVDSSSLPLGSGSTISMSADGRYVAFVSSTTYPGNLYVRDRQTNTTEQDVGDNNYAILQPAISADGRYVAFSSYADNLVPGDTNAAPDVFVYDRENHSAERVSVDSAGGEGHLGTGFDFAPSRFPVISADGRYVAFDSDADNLVSGDTNGINDVFVHDQVAHTTEAVSVDGAGLPSGSREEALAMSLDGRFVAFRDEVSFDVVVRDRGADTTQTAIPDCLDYECYLPAAFSADGRYFAFTSRAAVLVPDDTNATPDVFVYERATSSPDVAVAVVPPAGGVISTPGTTATAVDPIITSVGVPPGVGGAVTIIESGVPATPRPSGYTLVNFEAVISAPPASTSAPLQLTFRLDGSLFAGTPLASLVVLRDASPVATCVSTAPEISPDPCLESAVLDGDDAVLTVLTSAASTWDVGVGTGEPSAPLNVVAAAHDGYATVMWSAPTSEGSAPIDSYTVTAMPGSTTCSPATVSDLTCDVTGLSNGSTYTITVIAHNYVGSGPASVPINVTPATFPGRSRGVVVTPGVGRATVSWTAPADDGGAAIYSYVVYATPTGGNCSPATLWNLTCDITGLSNGTVYNFIIGAFNSVGQGPSSSPVTLMIGYPASPRDPVVTAGDGQASIAFGPPDRDGGSPVVDYLASCASPDGGVSATQAGAGSPILVTGLHNGSTYACTVTARNVLGHGPATEANVSVTTLAGSRVAGYADGVGSVARFFGPFGVAVAPSGNVYVADGNNERIRIVTPGGSVTTLAGSGTVGFTDGVGTGAEFHYPSAVAVDEAGFAYVADWGNNAIRKIAPDGTVTTLAGSGPSGLVNGQGGAARFNGPIGVAVDASGNVFVADSGNQRIRKITPAGSVTTLAGSGTPAANGYVPGGFVDGVGTAARFWNPSGVAVDATGNVFVADSSNRAIREITPAGMVTTVAGSGTSGFVDAAGSAAQFAYPNGIALDRFGTIYVNDSDNARIRRVSSNGVVTTLAGSYARGLVDGGGTAAQFNGSGGLAIDASGNLYVGEVENNAIRKITTGVFRTDATVVSSGGGTASTGSIATASDPVATAVVVPAGGSGGTVTITESAAVTIAAPPGYVLLGQEIQVEAPPATTSAPLTLTFRLDASTFGATPVNQLAIFRNGVPVVPCGTTSPSISPDPCRASATIDGATGNAVLTVLTSHASTWDVGVSTSPITTVDQSISFGTTSPASPQFTDGTFTVSASASSGLAVSYASATGAVCTVDSATGVVTIIHPGSCTVTADQAGDAAYNAAPQASQTTIIASSAQAALVAVPPASGVYGQSYPLSTTGGSGSGAVSYSVGSSTACSIAGASLMMTSGTGTCDVTATKAADVDYNLVASSPVAVTVARADQAALVVSAPATGVYGQSYPLSTTGGSGSGAVSYSVGSSTACTVTGALLTVIHGTGTCDVIGTKAADADYNPVTSSAMTITVTTAATTSSLMVSSGSAVYGQPVTMSVTVSAVSAGLPIPTGSVSVTDGTSQVCGGVLSAGQFVCVNSALAVGPHALSVSYTGDGDFSASGSAPVSVSIAKAPTTTSLVSSANPAVKGQSVTFTATVSAAPSVATPTGTVTFKAGTTTLCSSVALGAGVAICTTSTLPIGTSSISATYTATGNFLGSSSAALAQVVTRIQTTTSLSSSVNPTVTGQATVVKVTVAAVSPGSGTPAGFVTIFDGASPIAVLTLTGGTASTSRTFTVGTHVLTAIYSGSLNYTSSSSAPVSQVARQASTSVALTTSGATVTFGTSVRFTATVRAVAPGSGTPGGTVTFYDGATSIGTVTLSGAGSASLSTSALTRGTHTITAKYNGSPSYLTSTSAALTERVT